ncbi:MAG: twin-arginine translocase subunit TatC [Balneolaceae bacterium]
MSEESDKRGIMGSLLPIARTPKQDPNANMSFLDHLEELRWRIIKGMLGVLGGIIVALFFSEMIMEEIILGPTRADFFMYRIMPIDAVELSLISRKLPGQFFTYWGTLIIAGTIIGSPVLFYQMYAFLEPALESGEKLKTFFNVCFITFFFLLGISFGYFILVPFAVQFFTQYVISDVISNEFDINEYFSSVALWVLCCGVIFQIPVVSYFLSKIGILTPEILRQFRRHAIIGAMILASFLTPPDPVSQLMIAFPLILLYQLAIWISKVANRQRKRAFEKAMSGEEADY